jgi:hypothetical protein
MKSRGYTVRVIQLHLGKIHAIRANGSDLLRRADDRKLDENHT